MVRIGITERGDGGLDFSWVKKIDKVDGVICVSKAANDELIKNLLNYKDKVIYHSTCTGMGSTKIEPNVPSVEDKLNHVQKLIMEGFPINHIIMRIDPLIPISTGDFILGKSYLDQIEKILQFCNQYELKVRYSYLDIYSHVRERFISNNIPITSFLKKDMNEIQNLFKKYSLKYMSCGEKWTPESHKIGCVSIEDFKILGLDTSECVMSQWRQRNVCLCCSAKKELLNNKKPCYHGCLYCYWKNNNELV